MFTTDEIIERLKVLWRKLEDEGLYVGANTIQVAVVRLEELSKAQIEPTLQGPWAPLYYDGIPIVREGGPPVSVPLGGKFIVEF